MFLGRRGAGEVIGLAGVASDTVRLAMPDNAPKGVGAKFVRGIRVTGESGDEEGELSDKSEESVHDTVVVGDDSTDSVACVDVLSLCLCDESAVKAVGRKSCADPPGSFVGSITSLGSKTVTRLC